MEEEREGELRSGLDFIGEHTSERERAAAAAEDELMNWRKADFMAARVGEEFTGIITSVKDYGFYVELNEFFVEGMVHVSTLVDDLYEYHPRKHRLVGARSGRKFRLGDEVRVAVIRVDRARHLIDFAIV
jgi:ribonuclease R